MTKMVVSNLLGGIGYFYGSSLIQSKLIGSKTATSWPVALFTATPSRSLFPRGFLWDEGFHNLVISRWNPSLAMEIVGHWLDLLNAYGWIPREQILGYEARARVPKEFVVQTDSIANPPSLILAVESLLDNVPNFSDTDVTEFRSWSALVLPRLHVWYQWFNTTQSGPLPLTYRWRGRNAQLVNQLNPLTLSSGLDDYPRASHPSTDERHLDLRCWMTLFAKVMVKLGSFVAWSIQSDFDKVGSDPIREQLEQVHLWIDHYKRWANQLSDMDALERLHWSDDLQRFADYGLHTDAVRLEIRKQPSGGQGAGGGSDDKPSVVRVADEKPSLQLVTSTFGYVSMFPLFLRLLSPTSPRLPILLAQLGDKNLLWTDHGLRSLSPQSPLYDKPNTPNDPPYWRGAIWFNMNYLAFQSLHYYATNKETPPDVARLAADLAQALRNNLGRTVLGEFDATGNLWEQYNDRTGRGQRGHPFCGWSSLVSLVVTDPIDIADNDDDGDGDDVQLA